MRIEILTSNVEKKPDILTYLKDAAGFQAEDGRVRADGVEVEVAPKYILITATVPWMADELVRRIFTVSPVPYAPGFYEIAGDVKIIATSAARPLTQIIECLEVLDHVDTEAGELAGRFETAWAVRDVSVGASFEVMVQGGVAVSKIKFRTHFRETEQNCRKAVGMVSLCGGISLISPEGRDFSRPAYVSPVAMTASTEIGGMECAGLLNQAPGRVIYLEEKECYRVVLPGEGNHILLTGKERGRVHACINLETPWELDWGVMGILGDCLGLARVDVGRVVKGIALAPEDLLNSLGFVKEDAFFTFRASLGELEARYDIGRREMNIGCDLAWDEAGKSRELFNRIGEFTGRVIKYAV